MTMTRHLRLPLYLTLFLGLVRSVSAQAWSQLAPNGGPPSPRLYSSAVYASASGRLIVFGGYSGSLLNDLWILNRAGTSSWQQQIPQGAQGSPPPRASNSAVYDPSSNRMIIFGGETPGVTNNVWILTNADGTTGTPTWTQRFPTNPPPSRTLQTAVYDPVSNRMIIYGGQNAPSGGAFLGDIWVLTNANGTEPTPSSWIMLSPNGPLPTSRSHHMAAYDSTLNKMVIYGGEGLVDTWVLSNANGLGGSPQWTLLAPSGQLPSQISDTRSMYDPQSQRLILFGGFTSSDVTKTNATFVLINAMGIGSPTWQSLNPSGTLPSPRCCWAGGYDQLGNALIVFGGQSTTFLNDTWVLTNANGLAGAQLTVSQVSPNDGGNAGTATVALTGADSIGSPSGS